MSVIKRLIGLFITISLCGTVVFAVEPAGSAMAPEAAEGYLSAYEEPICREEFCYLVISLMAEMQGSSVSELYQKLTDKQKNEPFADVDADNPYIALAKKYELVVGKNGMVFSPDEPIKRQEAASIILNLVRQVAPEYYDDGADYARDIPIEDHVEIADWGRDAVAFVLGTELMKTDQNGNFDPTASITVEEAVILISSVRVYLNTPLPEEEIQEEKPLPYLWIAGAAALAVLVVLVIVLLRRNSKKRRTEKEEWERQLESALDLRLSPEETAKHAAPPAQPAPERKIPPRQAQPAPEKKFPPRQAQPAPERKIPPRQAQPAPPPDLPQHKIPPQKPAAPQPPAGGETVYIGQVNIPRLKISGVQGTEIEALFELSTPVTVGRTESSRLCLPSSTVSRTHCRIYWDGKQALVENISAKNPVEILRGLETLTVQDRALPLDNGDILRLGSLRVKVELC